MKSPSEHPELANYMLGALAHVCFEHDILYFIIGGTCLGFYRDDGYILGDNDLDVAIIHSQYCNELPALLHPWGLLADSYGKFEGQHYWKDDMLLDITWVEPTGFYAAYDIVKGYPVPSPVEEYLAWKYGDTWQTPMTAGYSLQHEE